MSATLLGAWKALDAVLPYVERLISLAVPHFTKKKEDKKLNQAVLQINQVSALQMELVNEQIGELQAASSQNTEHIKELAAQLKKVVEAFDKAALNVATEQMKARRLFAISIAISFLTLISFATYIVTR